MAKTVQELRDMLNAHIEARGGFRAFALPTSGVITASMINEELGRSYNNYFHLNGTEERALAGKPTPESYIKLSDFFGKVGAYGLTVGNQGAGSLALGFFDNGSTVYGDLTPGTILYTGPNVYNDICEAVVLHCVGDDGNAPESSMGWRLTIRTGSSSAPTGGFRITVGTLSFNVYAVNQLGGGSFTYGLDEGFTQSDYDYIKANETKTLTTTIVYDSSLVRPDPPIEPPADSSGINYALGDIRISTVDGSGAETWLRFNDDGTIDYITDESGSDWTRYSQPWLIDIIGDGNVEDYDLRLFGFVVGQGTGFYSPTGTNSYNKAPFTMSAETDGSGPDDPVFKIHSSFRIYKNRGTAQEESHGINVHLENDTD